MIETIFVGVTSVLVLLWIDSIRRLNLSYKDVAKARKEVLEAMSKQEE